MENGKYSHLDTVILIFINYLMFFDKVFFKIFKVRSISKLEFVVGLKEDIIFRKLNENKNKYPINKIFINSNKKIIWTAWFQGKESAPPLVKLCIESFSKIPDHQIIVVTSDNYKEYISLPKFIIKKFEKGIISYTAFSELIRLELLSVYGGIWIDATVFIHKPVTVSLEDEPFYTLKGVSSLKRGEFLGFVPVYFMGCREKYDAVVEVRDYLFSYWEANNKQIDYFLIDYCFKLVYLTDISFSKIMNSHPLVGADRFLLINMINKEYNFSNLMKINSCKYGVFKLSNKYKLEEEDSSEKLTFWGHMLRNRSL